MFDFIEGVLDFFGIGSGPENEPKRRKSPLERLVNCGCLVIVILLTLGVIWFTFNAQAILNTIMDSLP